MDDVLSPVRAIADIARTSYGPFGLDQLVVTGTQKLVTNSSSRILALGTAGSPLAKVVLDHLVRTGNAMGDGTGTLALLLEGALRQCATSLEAGARVAELSMALGYLEGRILPDEVAPLFAQLRCPADFPTERLIRCIARTFFGANFPPDVSNQLGVLFWRWLCANAACVEAPCGAATDPPPSSLEPEALAATARRLQQLDLVKVPVQKLAGEQASAAGGSRLGVAASTVERTHLLSGVLGHPSMPVTAVEGHAVIFDESAGPLPLQVSSLDEAHSRISELLLVSVERLWQHGVRVVLCAAEVHEELRGALARRGVLLLHLVEPDELALLEAGRTFGRLRAANASTDVLRRALLRFASVRPVEAGFAAPRLAGGQALWTFVPGNDHPVPHCWLLLRAPTVGLAGEYKHALLRLLLVAEQALLDTRGVIFGGLAFEIAAARLAHIRATADTRAEARRGLVGMFGLQDPAKAARLQRLAWQILRAALAAVLEAFIANLAPSGSPPIHRAAGMDVTGAASPQDGSNIGGAMDADACQGMLDDPRRFVRWLLAAAPDVLRGAGAQQAGLCTVPVVDEEDAASHCFFAALPGTAARIPMSALNSAGDDHAMASPLEPAQIKLGLLRALCGLCRQLVRLDPETMRARGGGSHDSK